MVKSWVCPRCLGDLDAFYTEEGDTMVTDDRIVCPNCGYKEPHVRGVPCYTKVCPKCETRLTGR